jgi:hypothetical protein
MRSDLPSPSRTARSQGQSLRRVAPSHVTCLAPDGSGRSSVAEDGQVELVKPHGIGDQVDLTPARRHSKGSQLWGGAS